MSAGFYLHWSGVTVLSVTLTEPLPRLTACDGGCRWLTPAALHCIYGCEGAAQTRTSLFGSSCVDLVAGTGCKTDLPSQPSHGQIHSLSLKQNAISAAIESSTDLQIGTTRVLHVATAYRVFDILNKADTQHRMHT